jgi:hypothetical protein
VEYSTKLLLGNEQLKKAQQATAVLQKRGFGASMKVKY